MQKKINLHRQLSHKMWTEKENKEFDRLYPKTASKKLARKFNCSLSAIYGHADARGVSKDKEWIRREYKKLGLAAMNHPAMKANRFRKGIKLPHQFKPPKGFHAKGSEKGWFKKGHLPHNTKTDGAITIRFNKTGHNDKMRPYKYIRLELGRWKELHVVLWERKYGKVPHGHRVMFKDGNTMNCTIRNLVLRTDKEAIEQTWNTNEFIAALMSQKKSRRFGFKPDERLKREILKRPDLINAKREQLKLQKLIRERENGK